MHYAYTFVAKDKDGHFELVHEMTVDGPIPHLDQDRTVWLQFNGAARKFEVTGIELLAIPDTRDSVGIRVSVCMNEDHNSTEVTAETLAWIGRPK
jgi:hypothetical protein